MNEQRTGSIGHRVTSTRVHVLQHVPFEDLGSIKDWTDARGASVSYTRMFAGDPLPSTVDVDFLIALGGPMSVNDEADLPWLATEKAFIRSFIATERPLLGVCLGAQLVASALHANVSPQLHKEIGWFPVRSVGTGSDVPFPAQFEPFHWHGETFDIPPGAVRIAESDGCANQAFRIRDHVVGLQFHLEATPQSVQALVCHCANELTDGPYIQPERQLREAPPETYDEAHGLMRQVLNHLVRR